MSVVGHILVCYLIADFIAGFWHWIEDRYFEESWPIIGKYIATPNALHHAQPTEFLNGSYWHRNYTTIIPAFAAAVLTWMVVGWTPWMLVWAFVSQANEIHAFSHRKGKLPQWIAVVQETGLFQSPRQHGEHHRSPFLVNYCVMSDWLNPWLDWFQFWRRLEIVLEKTIGLKPRVDPLN